MSVKKKKIEISRVKKLKELKNLLISIRFKNNRANKYIIA